MLLIVIYVDESRARLVQPYEIIVIIVSRRRNTERFFFVVIQRFFHIVLIKFDFFLVLFYLII